MEDLASVALKAMALKEDMVDMVTLLAWAETPADGNLECTAPGPEVVESGAGTDLDPDLALADRTEGCKQSPRKQI